MAAATAETMHIGKMGARPRANLALPQNPKVQTTIPEQPVTMERPPYNPPTEPKGLVNPGELALAVMQMSRAVQALLCSFSYVMLTVPWHRHCEGQHRCNSRFTRGNRRLVRQVHAPDGIAATCRLLRPRSRRGHLAARHRSALHLARCRSRIRARANVEVNQAGSKNSAQRMRGGRRSLGLAGTGTTPNAVVNTVVAAATRAKVRARPVGGRPG